MNKINKDFYNKCAVDFFENTYNLDLSELYKEFLPYVTKNGYILDIGAGSGRDTNFFKNKGYKVDAIDPSVELISLAKSHFNIKILNVGILDYKCNIKYDGIWACASLLHLTSMELVKTFVKIEKITTNNACVYLSFKYGEFEGIRNNRFFNDMTKEKFHKLNNKSFTICKVWTTNDVRKRDKKWLNIILRRK